MHSGTIFSPLNLIMNVEDLTTLRLDWLTFVLHDGNFKKIAHCRGVDEVEANCSSKTCARINGGSFRWRLTIVASSRILFRCSQRFSEDCSKSECFQKQMVRPLLSSNFYYAPGAVAGAGGVYPAAAE